MTGDALMAFVNDELFPTLKELPDTARDGRRRVVRGVFEDAYNYMKSGQLMRQVINKITAIDFNNLAERQHFGDIYEQILNDLQSAGNAGEYYTARRHRLLASTALIPGLARSFLTPPVAPAVFSPVPSATCANAT
jgi:type I restriction enzyme M protein